MVGIEGTTGVWRGDELRIEDEGACWTWIDTPVESLAKKKDGGGRCHVVIQGLLYTHSLARYVTNIHPTRMQRRRS
jgi:hypothetical protein